MGDVIIARSLNKKFNNTHVLSNIDLNISACEIVAIVGHSGAGKTTLLHILGTLEKPEPSSKTSLIIDGTNITQLSRKALAKFRNQHLGFVFQFYELLPEFTALENVCLPAWIANGIKPKDETKKKALALLEEFGMAHCRHQKPATLSGGEQQRVAVARALINKPKIIFADEPSGNLDSKNAEILHKLFFRLREREQCSLIIVTHNEALARKADRIIAIKDGRIQPNALR